MLGLCGRVRREHYDEVSADAPVSEDSAVSVADMIADDSMPDAD